MDRLPPPSAYQPPAVVERIERLRYSRLLRFVGWINIVGATIWLLNHFGNPLHTTPWWSIASFSFNALAAVVYSGLTYGADLVIAAIERPGRKRHLQLQTQWMATECEAHEAVYGVVVHTRYGERLSLRCRSFTDPTGPALAASILIENARWLPTDRDGTVAQFPAASFSDDGLLRLGDQVVLMSRHNVYDLPGCSPDVPAEAENDDFALLREFE